MTRGVLVDAVLGLYARTSTFPLPQLQGVPLFDPLVMPAVGAETREGEVHLFVEFELLGDDPKRLGTLLVTLLLVGAADYFIQD